VGKCLKIMGNLSVDRAISGLNHECLYFHNGSFLPICAPSEPLNSLNNRTSIMRAEGRGGYTKMIKSELIQKIADDNPHLFQRDVELIVSTVFDEIIDAMASGNRVELRGFGAFSVKKREARTGRNPRTGESVKVDAKYVPFFKTGKLLRDRLNND